MTSKNEFLKEIIKCPQEKFKGYNKEEEEQGSKFL